MKRFLRFLSITGILVKHGLAHILERFFIPRRKTSRESASAARRIRMILEELGPSFIKLGQLMGTRADVFPPEYIDEFNKLQDQVPPIRFPEIKRVVEAELGRPLPDVFPEFDESPIGSASVAQVHAARLHTGEKVAVKIIRPGIAKKIRADIGLMYFLATILERLSHTARLLALNTVVAEFERFVFKELDMLIEAGNVEKFARNFKGDPEIYIPKVYWDFTSKSVLVLEYIEGIKMDQVAALQEHGIDPQKIARIGLRSFSRQLMEFGFFHADPHSGNTIVMLDGRVSLVDFGIMGYLDEETSRQVADIFLGYAEHDYDQVMDALLKAGLVDKKNMDLKQFKSDLIESSEIFYGRSLKHISVKNVSEQAMRLLLKYHLRPPRNLLLLMKTFIQTEALGKILASEASLLEAASPYARKLIEQGLSPEKISKAFWRDTTTLAESLRAMPAYVREIMEQTAKGQQRFRLDHSGFAPLMVHLSKGINRLIVCLIVAASIIAASVIMNSSEKIAEVPIHWFGIGAVPLTTLLGLIGYIIATGLGVWLIWSIVKSDRL
jgi:ubiquinone biosynthesis protein